MLLEPPNANNTHHWRHMKCVFEVEAIYIYKLTQFLGMLAVRCYCVKLPDIPLNLVILGENPCMTPSSLTLEC